MMKLTFGKNILVYCYARKSKVYLNLIVTRVKGQKESNNTIIGFRVDMLLDSAPVLLDCDTENYCKIELHRLQQ